MFITYLDIEWTSLGESKLKAVIPAFKKLPGPNSHSEFEENRVCAFCTNAVYQKKFLLVKELLKSEVEVKIMDLDITKITSIQKDIKASFKSFPNALVVLVTGDTSFFKLFDHLTNKEKEQLVLFYDNNLKKKDQILTTDTKSVSLFDWEKKYFKFTTYSSAQSVPLKFLLQTVYQLFTESDEENLTLPAHNDDLNRDEEEHVISYDKNVTLDDEQSSITGSNESNVNMSRETERQENGRNPASLEDSVCDATRNFIDQACFNIGYLGNWKLFTRDGAENDSGLRAECSYGD